MLTNLRHKLGRRWRKTAWDASWQVYLASARRNCKMFGTFPSVEVEVEKHGLGTASYVISPQGISSSAVVYSFGVGCDVSFDLSLIDRYELEVFAFDPTEESANYVDSIDVPKAFHFAREGIGAEDGEMSLTTVKPASAYYRPATTLDVRRSVGDTLRVPIRSLRSIMDQLGHGSIDIMKLDVEGAEYDVIDSIAAWGAPAGQIVLEFHPHMVNLRETGRLWGKAGWTSTERAMQQLAGLGYRVFHVSQRGTEVSLMKA